jgi:hypothetical protein
METTCNSAPKQNITAESFTNLPVELKIEMRLAQQQDMDT